MVLQAPAPGVTALYDVPAPAKLNLFLHVVGRRPDGYHLLQTVFRFIGLYDYLDFDLRTDGRIVCETTFPGIAPEDDLVVKAAMALQKASGTSFGAQISYRKNIPSGGGLGGGSSDAASTLIALNRLWGTGLTRHQLMQLALPLGADVPVFIFGQPAFAEGIGEVLSPVPMPDRAYVVVQPTQSVPTAGIFSSPDLTRNTDYVKITVFTDWQESVEQKKKVGSNANNALFGRNDLQPVVFGKYPAVQNASRFIESLGVTPRMTGSGACLFVEFVTLSQAEAFQEKIVGKIACYENGSTAAVSSTWVCPGLANHPLYNW
ncbi:4-(cytidine 5'-diphospho)-2-C-methyl-D-erythritol kinase [Pusillimonas sp. NJUB218]|uniref:4-(cytidine 5'-diphospho)-2-C-methyl-D-erythritol kinase n=1 Tax=Pusillimonas sp. NJUB218 TaxID=2023230 RepID=UPI000F4B3433|nr:4-(cytidine 5'-diphospho)-2-C-methyl-D-erythritol kinase [Pusillimonas sp. NJUB218]ROT46807.1 4-(cytidine 5'-diphospho)-2-C-methyl-D-erythritol kinase [Pusillimonas sp. NJUB218]